MAKLGALKPLRGTASSLANIVLQEGEIAFDYLPSGAYGDYGIKMGDGSTKYSNLPYLIKRSKEDPNPWQYDTSTNEAALLNNIKHPEYETIGKIYYIQSYMNDGNKQVEGASIQQNIPYKVIGINHESTTNTVDLQAMVAVNYKLWNRNYEIWSSGMYSVSSLGDWTERFCQNGYSSNIQAKMVYMTERWREATSNTTGTLQARSTKCKILNPLELYGSSMASYNSTLGTVPDFTQYNYGGHYSRIFPNNTTSHNSRVRYHDKAMTDEITYWTNSYYASGENARCFYVSNNGSCNHTTVNGALGVVPVIRLQD